MMIAYVVLCVTLCTYCYNVMFQFKKFFTWGILHTVYSRKFSTCRYEKQ